MNEIKKAFETMKKELKKELNISGGFTMSARQIENRTATYLVCNLISYEKEIKYHEDTIERISKSNRTDADKQRWYDDCNKWVSFWKSEQAKYGTKENFVKVEVERIVNSKAFAKFSEAVGGCKYHVETKTDCGMQFVYLRFNY